MPLEREREYYIFAVQPVYYVTGEKGEKREQKEFHESRPKDYLIIFSHQIINKLS